MIVNDFIWSVYIKSLSKDRMLRAAIFASLAVLFEAAAVIIYVGNYWTLIPAIIGAFLGTYLTKYFERKELNLKQKIKRIFRNERSD